MHILKQPIPIHGHADTDTLRNFHIQIQLYGVSRYAVFSYVRFRPTLYMTK